MAKYKFYSCQVLGFNEKTLMGQPEDFVCIGHLGNLSRMNKRTKLDHVEARLNQLIYPYELSLRGDYRILDLQAVPQPHLVKQQRLVWQSLTPKPKSAWLLPIKKDRFQRMQ